MGVQGHTPVALPPVPILQQAGRSQGPVWTGEETFDVTWDNKLEIGVAK